MKKAAYILMGLVLFLSACGVNGKNEETGTTNEKVDPALAKANNELGFQLLKHVEANEDGNAFISPTSALFALSMIAHGASGDTESEILQALQLDAADSKSLGKSNLALKKQLEKQKAVELEIANSLWLNKDYEFTGDFSKQMKDDYNAKLEEMDIADPKSADKINNWVKKSTNGKIDKMVDPPLDQDLVAILMNAIYFKGDWTYEFDKDLTENRPFDLDDGTTKEVPTMTLSRELAYMETEQFQAVKLPYGKYEQMHMSIFLPAENTDIHAFSETLTAANWKAWNSEFAKKEGTIQLPKLKMDYETTLNDALQALGMQAAFNPNEADFSKMVTADKDLFLSLVKQKTYIDVNEKGTEAAAVTSGEIKVTSAPADEPFHMDVNRPYFFSITDEETGTILFLGAIANPVQ